MQLLHTQYRFHLENKSMIYKLHAHSSICSDHRLDAMTNLMAKVGLVSVWICVIIVLLATHGGSAMHMHNTILYQINANGSAVVLQTIGSLQQCEVLGNDNELLRRIAYVETRDGTLTTDSNDGSWGIWAVRENKFLVWRLNLNFWINFNRSRMHLG